MECANQLKTLNDITGATKNEADKYYVYGLYEKESAVPFYIGKGQGKRIFEHKDDAMVIWDLINTNGDEHNTKLSSKIETIIRHNGEIIPVIIKFGLTEQEAFAAESALINLCNYHTENASVTSLTNLVSGHGSKREKSAFSKDNQVKARTVENFIDNYYIPDFDVSTIKESCIMIKINHTYQAGDSISDVYEHVRGVWRLSEKRIAQVKYALALYRGICVGVFKIDGWKKAYEHDANCPFPVRRYGLTEATLVKYDDVNELKLKEPVIYEEQFSMSDNPQEKLTRWRNGWFFYGDSSSVNVPEPLRKAVGRRLTNIGKDINNQANPIYLTPNF